MLTTRQEIGRFFSEEFRQPKIKDLNILVSEIAPRKQPSQITLLLRSESINHNCKHRDVTQHFSALLFKHEQIVKYEQITSMKKHSVKCGKLKKKKKSTVKVLKGKRRFYMYETGKRILFFSQIKD